MAMVAAVVAVVEAVAEAVVVELDTSNPKQAVQATNSRETRRRTPTST